MNESSSASGGNGEICNFNKVKLMKKQRMNEKILKKRAYVHVNILNILYYC